MLKMVYTVLFFGMNTECGKFPSTFKIDKERNKQQVDQRRAGKNGELEKKPINRKHYVIQWLFVDIRMFCSKN